MEEKEFLHKCIKVFILSLISFKSDISFFNIFSFTFKQTEPQQHMAVYSWIVYDINYIILYIFKLYTIEIRIHNVICVVNCSMWKYETI